MTPEQIATIAAELTTYQRAALRAAEECKGGWYWTPYRVEDTRLAHNGTLTNLGLAVRSYLEENK